MARCLATIAALLVVLTAASAAQEDDVVYAPGNGVSLPRVIRDVRPNYTADAMRAGVEGVVVIEAIVLPDGKVGRVKLLRSLDPDYGLDAASLNAARQWTFKPGMKDGKPVAVRITIENAFTLGGKKRK